jgi:hypothetical protein
MAEPRIRERVKGTAASTLQEATSAKKTKGKVGRAPKSPDEEVLKLKAFNLPLTLIQEIVDYANVKYNGNASALAVDVFREFLKYKEGR